MNETWFQFIMLLALLIFVIVTLSWLINLAHGYSEKTVTLTLHKQDFAYCYFGNEQKPTAVCNTMKLKESFYLMDQFLQIMNYGVGK